MRLDVALIVQLQAFGVVVSPQPDESSGERDCYEEGYCQGAQQEQQYKNVEHGGRRDGCGRSTARSRLS